MRILLTTTGDHHALLAALFEMLTAMSAKFNPTPMSR